MSANKPKAEEKQQDTEANSLAGELASLFGAAALTRAMNSRVEDLDFTPGDVVSASRELRRLAGNPKAQQVIARCLPDDIQAVLCMWMLDAGMPAKVIKAQGGVLQ